MTFFRVYIASYKHEGELRENSRQLYKPETQSRVCITVENSPNSPESDAHPQTEIQLCNLEKKSSIAFIKYFSKVI